MTDDFDFINLLFTIFISILFFVIGVHSKRPKIVIGGGGGGSKRTLTPPNTIHHYSVFITNSPRFFGLKIDRQAAIITIARIRDIATNEFHTLPFKHFENSTGIQTNRVSIEPGERLHIHLFAKIENTDEYCIFCKETPEESMTTKKYKENRKEFELQLFDSCERLYKFNFSVTNKTHDLSISPEITIDERSQLIKSAIQTFLRAFRFGKYW